MIIITIIIILLLITSASAPELSGGGDRRLGKRKMFAVKRGKAELWLSPLLRRCNSIFWWNSGELPVKIRRIPANFRGHSGEIQVKDATTKKANSAFPHSRASI